jgi:hypothetical protein
MAEGSLPRQRVCSQRWGPRSEKACGPPHRTDPYRGSAQDRRQVSLLKTTPNSNARLRLLGHADHDRRAVAHTSPIFANLLPVICLWVVSVAGTGRSTA